MAREPDDWRVERLLPSNRHLLSQCVSGVLDLLLRVATTCTATALPQLDRHKPVHIWVLQFEHHSAGAALAAWIPRLRCVAMNQLSKPQREALFPDSTGTDKQYGLRQL